MQMEAMLKVRRWQSRPFAACQSTPPIRPIAQADLEWFWCHGMRWWSSAPCRTRHSGKGMGKVKQAGCTLCLVFQRMHARMEHTNTMD